MLVRFCLYGFFRNQQYFEPFFFLALLGRGFDFFQLGILFGFKAVLINLLEVPTGAVSDSLGRRGSLITSHFCYLMSFIAFALAEGMGVLLAGMACYALGETFRSGTHKAIIFGWLKAQERTDEKTQVYGITRSWSKLGSALGALLAGTIVFVTESYAWLFWLSIIPISCNLINFLGYPRDEKVSITAKQGFSHVWQILRQGVTECISHPPLRRLLVQGMAFEGTYKSCKDYVQPLMRDIVLGMTVLTAFSDKQRLGIMVGITYTVIYLLASFAARHAGTLTRFTGSEEKSGRLLWVINLLSYVFIAVGIVIDQLYLGLIGFMLLTVLQNLWRPGLVSRVAEEAESTRLATVLSTEEQSRTLFIAVAAPLIGYSVDQVRGTGWELMPVAALGIAICLVGLILSARRTNSNKIA